MKKNKQIQIVYGSLWPQDHFGYGIAREFAQRVKEKSNGELDVSITLPSPDSQLTDKVISGEIQMTSGHDLSRYVPQVGLTYLPYLYNDFDHFKKVWTIGESPVSNKIVKIIEDKVVVKVLGYSIIGYRDIILRQDRCITKAEDFQELVIRYDGSETTHNMFKAFGAKPVYIEYHTVKDAFQNGKIDAAANTSFNLIYMKWYEVCTHVS